MTQLWTYTIKDILEKVFDDGEDIFEKISDDAQDISEKVSDDDDDGVLKD